jgi:hypothetical protein
MSRTITMAGLLLAVIACLSQGCLSGGYEADFQSRLQQYKREAAGEPAAAEPAAKAADPPAAG